MEPPLIRRLASGGNGSRWTLCGSNIPKEEIVFFTQVILIYVVSITCIVNLALGIGDSTLWASLLSGSLGYLLPSPTLSKNVSLLPNPPVKQLDEVLSG